MFLDNIGAALDGLGFRVRRTRSCVVSNGGAMTAHPSRNCATSLEVPGTRSVSRDGCSVMAVHEGSTALVISSQGGSTTVSQGTGPMLNVIA